MEHRPSAVLRGSHQFCEMGRYGLKRSGSSDAWEHSCDWRSGLRGRTRHDKLEGSLRIQAGQHGIGKIVADDFPEAGAGFGHCFCAALAETDTVALSHTFKNHFSLFGSCGEIIAR